MKASIGLATRNAAPSTDGGSAFTGGSNDQCFSYGAPCSTQRRISSFCSAVSVLFALGGGMISSGSLDITRRTISLSSGLPGTIGVSPLSAAFKASSRTSSRSPASRVPGP